MSEDNRDLIIAINSFNTIVKSVFFMLFTNLPFLLIFVINSTKDESIREPSLFSTIFFFIPYFFNLYIFYLNTKKS